MTDHQEEVYAALAVRDLYPQPRMQAMFNALTAHQNTINELFHKEHEALDDGDIDEADRYRDLGAAIWQEVYKLEIRIHEALQWVSPIK